MIAACFATGTAICSVDFGSPAHFANHHHQRFIQQSKRLQIIEQCGHPFVCWWQQTVFKQGEIIVVSIPCFVVSQIHLDKIDTGLHKLSSHQERPAECIASVAIERLRGRVMYIKRTLDAGVGQQ